MHRYGVVATASLMLIASPFALAAEQDIPELEHFEVPGGQDVCNQTTREGCCPLDPGGGYGDPVSMAIDCLPHILD